MDENKTPSMIQKIISQKGYSVRIAIHFNLVGKITIFLS